MAELTTAGGGIHPGAPIIWPTLKPTSSSTTTQTTQTDQTTTEQTAQTAQTASTASPQSATAAQTQSQTAALTSQARALTLNDIKTHLQSMQVVDSEANVKLASLMLRFGIELSKENFMNALGMLEGTDRSLPTQEAALVLLSKGVNSSPEAVRSVATQLSESPSMSTQLSSIKQSLSQIASTLSQSPTTFSPQMLSQLSSLVGQFSAMVDDLPKKYKLNANDSSAISREQLINDARSMKSLIDGMQEKATAKNDKATPQNEAVRSSLVNASKKMEGLLDNLLSQVLLSQKSERNTSTQQDYVYYQIPNLMAKPANSVDIIIKKDAGKDAVIDPKNTQIVIGLETENLGKMTICMSVKDKKVQFLFNTQLDDIKKLLDTESKMLKTNLDAKGYSVERFQSRVNNAMCVIKPYLIPLLGLEYLFRVDSVA